jgi:hypothetical protein
VTIDARTYVADDQGHVALDGNHADYSIAVIAAEHFLDRRTLLRRRPAGGFDLWPSDPEGADGVTESFTLQIVYGGNAAQGSLARWTYSEVQVILLDSQDDPRYLDFSEGALTVQRWAIGQLYDALGGLVHYKDPIPGPDVDAPGTVRLRIRPGDPDCKEAAAWAWAAGPDIWQGMVSYCSDAMARHIGISIHELGHTLGLEHSPGRRDVMGWGANHRDDFSPRERAVLRLLMRREPGNRFPDTDFDAGAANRRGERRVFRGP